MAISYNYCCDNCGKIEHHEQSPEKWKHLSIYDTGYITFSSPILGTVLVCPDCQGLSVNRTEIKKSIVRKLFKKEK